MSVSDSGKDCKYIEKLISDFSTIILTKRDTLDIDSAKKYLDNLSYGDVECLNLQDPGKDSHIKQFLLDEIALYINSLDSSDDITASPLVYPFEFDSGGEYESFYNELNRYYAEKHHGNHLPSVLSFTMDYIKEMSEHYRIFGHFYDIRYTKDTNFAFKLILDNATKTAEKSANKAVYEVAQNVVKTEVEKSISAEMPGVTKEISERSVAILGIFSGIVLAIFAGLFYSTSVLNSISNSRLGRLLCLSAAIGLVALGLMTAMFKFIENMSDKDNRKKLSNVAVLVIAIILIGIMIFGYFAPAHPTDIDGQLVTSSDINSSSTSTIKQTNSNNN